MAEITAYTIVNGTKSDQYKYIAEVNSQREIEEHRKELMKKHNYKTGDYNICFYLKIPQGQVGLFSS